MSNHEEWAIIASVINDPSKHSTLELLPGDFEDHSHQMIWECVSEMVSDGSAIDLITLSDRLKDSSNRDYFPTVARILKEGQHASPKNLSAYAQILRDRKQSNQAYSIANDLIHGLQNSDKGAIDSAIRDLMGLQAVQSKYDYSLKEAIKASYERIQRVHELDGELPGVTTGITDLDDLTGGLQEGDLIVVAGRPAMGKTAFALNLMDKCGLPCGLISSEQGHEQIATRKIGITGRVDSYKLRTVKKLTQEDWQNITLAIKDLANRNVRIYDKPSPTIDEITRQARKWVFEYGTKVIFVDYIQRISYKSGLSRVDGVGEVVKGLKNLARELRIPVIGLSQVSRDVERNADKRPAMNHLANSSEIEKEADIIATMYRDEVYNNDSPDAGTCEIIICKNRHGPIAMVKTIFEGKYMRFENYSNELPQ
jgi:replicative DNA helicase